mgnify:CR=1 FL=1
MSKHHLDFSEAERSLMLVALYDAVQYELEFIDCHMIRGKAMRGASAIVKKTSNVIAGFKKLQLKLHGLVKGKDLV